LHLDEVDGGKKLAGIRTRHVLHVADVNVVLLGAGLEPAVRKLWLLLLCNGRTGSSYGGAKHAEEHHRRAAGIRFQAHHFQSCPTPISASKAANCCSLSSECGDSKA